MLLGYKTISKDMATIAFRHIHSVIARALSVLSLSFALNIMSAALINGFMECNISRFLTIGGIICFLLDWADGSIDMFVDFPKIGKRVANIF